MRLKIQIFILLILIGHLLLLFFNFSLVGFWTDFFIPTFLTTGFLYSILKKETTINSLRNTFRILTLGISIAYIFIGIRQINNIGFFSFLDSTKLTSFYWENVNDRTFNAYFQPVGAYSGGEGNFWITECLPYFPLIEETVYYKHAILWDFGVKEFDGQNIDQNKVIREYIKNEVIKNNGRLTPK